MENKQLINTCQTAPTTTRLEKIFKVDGAITAKTTIQRTMKQKDYSIITKSTDTVTDMVINMIMVIMLAKEVQVLQQLLWP